MLPADRKGFVYQQWFLVRTCFITAFLLVLLLITQFLILIKFYGIDYFIETYEVTEDKVYEFVSGTYENFPLKQSFKRNEHNKVMEYFDQNHIRVLSNE